MAHQIKPPKFDAALFSTKELCRLYRIIDNVEETANMAHHHVRLLRHRDSPTGEYLEQLQVFLGAERHAIVDALRRRADPSIPDDHRRLAVVIQFEAWCEEFHKETLSQLAASSLTTEAV